MLCIHFNAADRVDVHVRDGSWENNVLKFDDGVERIVIGRDPERCQIVFPPTQTHVGRQHCELIQRLGRFRLEVNRDDVVILDGKRVALGTELPAECDLQLGHGGPTLVLQSALSDTVPPTEGTDRQPGTGAVVESLRRRTIRAGVLVLVALGGLALIGAATWWNRTRIDVVAAHVVRLDHLSQEQQATVARLAYGLKTVDERLGNQEPELADRLQKAVPSVYLVLHLDSQGIPRRIGTCWVIDEKQGWLATNAHVAAECDPKTLTAGWQSVVRSPGSGSKTFRIDKVISHPGYAAFQKLCANYGPAAQTDATGDLSFGGFSATGCDVALLHVADPMGLAPALVPADPEKTRLLPGAPIGYVGYPMEGLSMGGTLLDAPAPVVHLGYVIRVTDYFGTNDPGTEPLLIAHSLPTAGGASGSPILNAKGEVVAIHSNGNPIGEFAGTDGQIRVDSPALFNFGQRADLVEEFFLPRQPDGRPSSPSSAAAEKRMPARLREWETTLDRHFRRRVTVKRQIAVKSLVADIAANWAGSGGSTVEYHVDTQPLAAWNDALVAAPAQSASADRQCAVNCDAPGMYLLAVSSDADSPLEMSVSEPWEGNGNRKYAERTDHGSSLPYVVVELQAAKTLTVLIRPQAANGEVRLSVVRGERRRYSVGELHERLVRKWLDQYSTPQKPYSPGQPTVHTGTIPPSAGGKPASLAFAFPHQPAGRYLITAVTNNGEAIGLSIDDPKQEALGSCISVDLNLATPGSISGLLTANRATETGYELRLFPIRTATNQ